MLLQRISHCFKYTSVLFNKAYQKQLLSTASNLNLTGHVDLSYRGDNGCIAVISLLHSGRMNALTGERVVGYSTVAVLTLVVYSRGFRCAVNYNKILLCSFVVYKSIFVETITRLYITTTKAMFL